MPAQGVRREQPDEVNMSILDQTQDKIERMTRLEGMPHVYELISEMSSIFKAEILRMEAKFELHEEMISQFVRDEAHPSDIISQLKTEVDELRREIRAMATNTLVVVKSSQNGMKDASERLKSFEERIDAIEGYIDEFSEESDKEMGNLTALNQSFKDEITGTLKLNKDMVRRLRKLESKKIPTKTVYVYQGAKAKPRPRISLPEFRLKVKPAKKGMFLYGLNNHIATDAVKNLLESHDVPYEFVLGMEGEGLYPKLVHDGDIFFGVKDIAKEIRKIHPALVKKIACPNCKRLNKMGNVICAFCLSDMPPTQPPIPHIPETIEDDETEEGDAR